MHRFSRFCSNQSCPSLVSSNGRFEGFTLIELLIVIAIILILIAIALPNFLEAQIRARVTKSKGEIRSLAIAMEAYFLDYQVYPSESEDSIYTRPRNEAGLLWLTSPVAYISSIPEDPFSRHNLRGNHIQTYESGGFEAGNTRPECPACMVTWAIFTIGPAQHDVDEIISASPHNEMPADDGSVESYNPTNGSKSRGNIFQFGGDGFWIGVGLGNATFKALYDPVSNDRGLMVNGIRYLHRLPPPLQ